MVCAAYGRPQGCYWILFCPTRLAQALPGMAIQCCCEGQNNNMLWRAVNASNDSV